MLHPIHRDPAFHPGQADRANPFRLVRIKCMNILWYALQRTATYLVSLLDQGVLVDMTLGCSLKFFSTGWGKFLLMWQRLTSASRRRIASKWLLTIASATFTPFTFLMTDRVQIIPNAIWYFLKGGFVFHVRTCTRFLSAYPKWLHPLCQAFMSII